MFFTHHPQKGGGASTVLTAKLINKYCEGRGSSQRETLFLLYTANVYKIQKWKVYNGDEYNILPVIAKSCNLVRITSFGGAVLVF